jgi:nucleotide-binding universal stress UspA family protein
MLRYHGVTGRDDKGLRQPMVKKILVPTDGSALASRAVDAAIEFAKSFGAEVVALHVHPALHAPYGTHDAAKEALERAHEDEGGEFANRLFADIRSRSEAAGVRLDTALVIGNEVWKEIIAVARSKKCDIICMATHGQRGFRALVLGSETQKVLLHSKLPVLVLH